MGAYAVEVILTRPATGRELASARRAAKFPLATSADRRRLLTVAEGDGWRRAVSSVWKSMGGLLPVDVITTVFANRKGNVLLSVRFDDSTTDFIRREATARGVSPESYLHDAVVDGVARETAARRARLDAALAGLLAAATPAELAASARRAISRAADRAGPDSAPGRRPVT